MYKLPMQKINGKPIAEEISRFKEIIDRPMGTINACGMIVSDPSGIRSVAGLLTDPNPRIRTRAAWTLGNAAAKNADISEARKALTLALSDCERDMLVASGYALTIHHMNMLPGTPAPLAGHRNEAVRHGANIAISDRGRMF